VEKERRPAPFAELSLESASLMKSMRVFCADAGGVVAGGVSPPLVVPVGSLSVVPEPASLAEPAEVALPEAASPAEAVDAPSVDETEPPEFVDVEAVPLEALEEPEVEPLGSLLEGELLAPPPEVGVEPLAGVCAETGNRAPAYPYAAVTFREYVRLSR
jgi:hypothetical protein